MSGSPSSVESILQQLIAQTLPVKECDSEEPRGMSSAQEWIFNNVLLMLADHGYSGYIKGRFFSHPDSETPVYVDLELLAVAKHVCVLDSLPPELERLLEQNVDRNTPRCALIPKTRQIDPNWPSIPDLDKAFWLKGVCATLLKGWRSWRDIPVNLFECDFEMLDFEVEFQAALESTKNVSREEGKTILLTQLEHLTKLAGRLG